MNCFKCGKDMECNDTNHTLKGITIEVKLDPPLNTPILIAYYKKQLGKYANGNGECNVGICYECYIDGLFQISPKAE